MRRVPLHIVCQRISSSRIVLYRSVHAREVRAELCNGTGGLGVAGVVFDEVPRELVERERGLVDRARAPDARNLEPALCVARALRREVRYTK